MEYRYDGLVMEILPHAHGCELRFWPDAGARRGSDHPPRFALFLTREGLQALAMKIREFQEQQELFES